MTPVNTILVGHVMDRLRQLPEKSVQTVITSPPYWGLRVYGIEPQIWGSYTPCPHDFAEHEVMAVGGSKGNWQQADNGTSHKTRFRGDVDAARQETTVTVLQGECRLCGAWRGDLGLEPTFALYLAHIVEVFREIRRVLRDDGLLWLNMGDCYAGSNKGVGKEKAYGGAKQLTNVGSIGIPVQDWSKLGLKAKNIVGMPWRVAFALQADGWLLRLDVIWSKPNSMPESATDRPTKSHEYVFMFSKMGRYFSDMAAIKERALGEECRPSSGWDMSTGAGGHGSIHADPRRKDDPHKTSSEVVVYKNARSVWTIPTEAFACEYCRACKRFYWSAEYQALAPVKIGDRESRMCRCGEPDRWLSHFATFPQELVEKCLLASTSEVGACVTCGTSWRRVTKKTYEATDRQPAPNKGKTEAMGERAANMTGDGFIPNRIAVITQRGFKPGCKCGGTLLDIVNPISSSRPCVVLDPFMGSGTVALVALRARRDFIGIELNPEYAEMAGHRIASERDQGRLL